MLPFLSNKYTNWYYLIVENAKSQQRIKNNGIYFENHHIVPKCMGGNNSKGNLVLLTAREHYIVHLLLVKMVEGKLRSKMSYAFRLMTIGGDAHERYVSRSYGLHKESSLQRAENHFNFGSKRSDETKVRMSKRHSGENNAMYGRKLSDETKLKISKATSGDKNHNYGKRFSKEIVRKQSLAKLGAKNPMYGKVPSDETRKLLSKAKKGIPQRKLTCTTCQKTGGIGNMRRYHFENCKLSL